VRVSSHVEQHLVGPVPVVAVVPRAEVEVVAEANTALAGPCTLRQYEVVSPGAPGEIDRHAVPTSRDAESGEIDHGGRYIQVVLKASVDTRLDARPPQDGRDVTRDFVSRLVIGVNAELAERLSVI
jgi:hypothetical protein